MYEIEFGEPDLGLCECCGAELVTLTRFVSRDGEAFAIYKAALAKGKHESRADIVMGIGDWSEGATSDSRTAFFCQIWPQEDQYNVTIIDAAQSSWASDFFGRRLSRDQALQHPLLSALFELTDYIIEADATLASYLEGRN
jgi:hypothetical protein